MEERYKIRKPEDTIKILLEFFSNKKLRLNIQLTESDIGSYSHRVDAYCNDTFVIGTNGKGTTEEYSLASALGELYERFCNKIEIYSNPLLNYKLLQDSYQEYGFYIDKNEHIGNYNDILSNNYLHYFFDEFTHNEQITKSLINYYTNYQPVMVPYTNIITQEISYLDPRLIIRANGSTGMSAGNNYKEAFCQGLSEIFERYVYHDTFQNPKAWYYQINLECITDPYILLMIDILHKQNKELYVYDMSYTYNLPVVCVILVDKIYHHTRINYGAFPDFNIALERCLTELYQNHSSFDITNDLIQKPNQLFKGTEELFYNQGGLDGEAYIPNNMLDKTLLKNTYNKLTFITGSTVDDIYNYYIDLIVKRKLNVYVRDNSSINTMTALHIFCDNVDVFNIPSEDVINYNIINYLAADKYCQSLYNLSSFIRGEHINNIEEDIYNLQIFSDNDKIVFCWADKDWTNLFYNTNHTIYELLKQLYKFQPILQMPEFIYGKELYLNLKSYITLYNYYWSGYDMDECLKIGTKLGININISEIAFNNPLVFIYEAYLNFMRDYYNSSEFNNIMQLYR